MRYARTNLAYGLLLAQTCAALPSHQRYILEQRQTSSNNSSSTTSSATSTSSTAATSTPSANDTTLSVSDLLGLPALTADDENFILTEKIIDLAGISNASTTTTERRAAGTSYNNPTKWQDLYMDEWLEGWANSTTVNGVLLKDSDNFLKDFWVSTDDETIFTCNNILGACDATKPQDPDRAGAAWDDRMRAFYARQAIQIWHAELNQAWQITRDVRLGAQTFAREIRETFVADPAAKPGSVIDVILPIIAMVGLLVPAVAPVAALIGGVAALAGTLDTRDLKELTETTLSLEDETPEYLAIEARAKVVPAPQANPQPAAQANPQPAAQANPQPAAQANPQPAAQANAQPVAQAQPAAQPQNIQRVTVRLNVVNLNVIPNPSVGDNIQKLEDRVKKIEDDAAAAKETIAKKLEGLKTTGDFLDKAAKVVTAVRAMYPGLPKSSVDSWTNFDSSVLKIFQGYQDAVEQSYLVNIKTWNLGKRTTKEGASVGAAGMKYILGSGKWFKAETSFSDIGDTTKQLSNFYRKVILMEVLKAQSIHLWKQHFDSKDACIAALNDYKKEDLIADINAEDQCAQRGTGAGSWELRIARKPLWHNTGYATNLGTFIKDGTGGGEIFFQQAVGTDSGATDKFQMNSAGYNKWSSKYLSDAGIGLTTNQIFDLSDECRKGANLFTVSNPTDSDRYKTMELAASDTGGINIANTAAVPKCLFSLPVLDINNDNLGWCQDNLWVGMMKGGAAFGPFGMGGFSSGSYSFSKNGGNCKSHSDFQYMADWYMCLMRTGPWDSTRVPVPGCTKHDQGGYKTWHT